MEQFDIQYNFWQNHENLNDIDQNVPRVVPHDLHPRFTGFVHALSFIFFFLRIIFFNFPNLKGMHFTPKLCKKYIYIVYHALSGTKDHRTSLPVP